MFGISSNYPSVAPSLSMPVKKKDNKDYNCFIFDAIKRISHLQAFEFAEGDAFVPIVCGTADDLEVKLTSITITRRVEGYNIAQYGNVVLWCNTRSFSLEVITSLTNLCDFLNQIGIVGNIFLSINLNLGYSTINSDSFALGVVCACLGLPQGPLLCAGISNTGFLVPSPHIRDIILFAMIKKRFLLVSAPLSFENFDEDRTFYDLYEKLSMESRFSLSTFQPLGSKDRKNLVVVDCSSVRELFGLFCQGFCVEYYMEESSNNNTTKKPDIQFLQNNSHNHYDVLRSDTIPMTSSGLPSRGSDNNLSISRSSYGSSSSSGSSTNSLSGYTTSSGSSSSSGSSTNSSIGHTTRSSISGFDGLGNVSKSRFADQFTNSTPMPWGGDSSSTVSSGFDASTISTPSRDPMIVTSDDHSLLTDKGDEHVDNYVNDDYLCENFNVQQKTFGAKKAELGVIKQRFTSNMIHFTDRYTGEPVFLDDIAPSDLNDSQKCYQKIRGILFKFCLSKKPTIQNVEIFIPEALEGGRARKKSKKSSASMVDAKKNSTLNAESETISEFLRSTQFDESVDDGLEAFYSSLSLDD